MTLFLKLDNYSGKRKKKLFELSLSPNFEFLAYILFNIFKIRIFVPCMAEKKEGESSKQAAFLFLSPY